MTLKNLLKTLEEKYGKNVIVDPATDSDKLIPEYISTGRILLDMAIGGDYPGIPNNRIIEIYGPPAGGKTTMALCIAAEAQKLGQSILFVDLEHTFSIEFAKKLGVDTETKGLLHVVHTGDGTHAMQIIEAFLKEKIDTGEGPGLVILDSVASIVSKVELERELGNPDIGSRAKLMSTVLPRLVSDSFKSKTPIIFINQTRDKVTTFKPKYGGPPKTTTGGNALPFYATIRMEVSKVGDWIKEGEQIVGHRVKVHIKKNKVGAPFREAEFNLYYDKGIDPYDEVAEAAVDQEIIERSGSWYSYEDKLKVQGVTRIAESLRKDKALFEEIKNKLTVRVARPDEETATFGEGT